MRHIEKKRATKKRSEGTGSVVYKLCSWKDFDGMGGKMAETPDAIGGEEMSPKLWSVPEVAEFLGLAVGTVYHLLSQKRLPCVRISGRCVRFDPRQIEAWVTERTEEPEAK
jgi:excisionase family DNA binding protein